MTSAIAPIVERELSKLEMGITSSQRVRANWIDLPFEGSSSLFRACGRLQYELRGAVPPINGQNGITLRSATKCLPKVFTNKSTEQGLLRRDAAVTAGWSDAEFSLQDVQTIELARAQLQAQYIKAVPVTSYPQPASASLEAALLAALKAPELASHFVRLQHAQVLLLQSLLVGRQEMTPALGVQTRAIMALPTSSAAVADLLKGWSIREASTAPVAAAQAVAGRVQSVLVIANRNAQFADDAFPFVDSILARLTPLVREQ